MSSPPGPPRSRTTLAAVERLRLAAVGLALTLAVFAQDSGSVAADTKLDMIVDPAHFLRRALQLWDPNGSAGQLQDQAYGYFFPMGPFFVVGNAMGLSPWVVQRSWEAAILVAAFLGMVRLARALGVNGTWSSVAAGLTYALAPRTLSEMFSISSELLPVAAAPWILLPLVTGARTGSPRRAAALSGVALLFAGGINASATLAVLPIPALWLLTRARGPRRASLIRWWSLSAALACAWWLVPLLVLGRYSPPFLDWIESGAVTTSQNSLFAALRGVDHWQAYLGPSVWPSGWVLVVVPGAVLATGGVAVLGLAGLARPELPHRAFHLLCLVTGLVLLTVGHRTGLGSPFAGSVQTLLDGPLAAFRNIHKFDPMVRLPLAVGVGHLLLRVRIPEVVVVRRGWFGVPYANLLAALAVIALGAVAAGPVFGGRMVPQARTVVEPVWWTQAAHWLARHSGDGRALIVPGAGRPDMLWGQTVDDPMQPVARSPWTVRDAVPLAQPAYVRLLDSVDQVFARGEANPVLAAVLARSGVKYVVVRNDLDTAAANATRLGYVHATLANSPGFLASAAFGPQFGGAGFAGQLTDAGLGGDRPAVEIFAVSGYSGLVRLFPAADAVTADGSADSLPDLLERSIDPDTPVIFSTRAVPGIPVVADDGIRRREITFGVPGVTAATMTADQPFAARRAEHDYLPADPGPLSTMRYVGIAGVASSSAGSDLTAPINRGPARGAFSAVDGDPATAWLSASFAGPLRQWLQLDLASAVDPDGARIAFAPGLGGYPSRIRVTTDTGIRDVDVASDDRTQPLIVPPGPTRHLRVTVLAVDGSPSSVGISTLSVPGVDPQRTLDVAVPTTPSILAFDTAPGFRNACLPVAGSAACDPANGSIGEEDAVLDRSFRLDESRRYHVAATVRIRPGRALDERLDAMRAATVSATSVQAADARVRPAAAIDGDPATTWTAAASDKHPALTLLLARPQTVREISISTLRTAPVSRIESVSVQAGARSWSGRLPADGVVRLSSPVRTDRIVIGVTGVVHRFTTDSQTRFSRELPTGIGEITVNGAAIPTTPKSAATLEFGCGSGIALDVDGRRIPLHATPTVAEAEAGLPTLAVPCGNDSVVLGAGGHRLRLLGGPTTRPDAITATAAGAIHLPAGAATSPTITSWGATRRTVRVSSGPASILVVRENANSGWEAGLDGQRLEPVTIDGWQQGYRVPAHSSGVVTLEFRPQRAYLAGLGIGALAVLLLLGLAVLHRSRATIAAPVPDGIASPQWAAWGLAVAGFVLLGVVGILLTAATFAVLGTVATRPSRLWLVGPAALAGVAVAAALFPPGSAHAVSDRWFVQLLCWISVLLACVSSSGWRFGGRHRPRRSSRRSSPYQETAATAVAATEVHRNSTQK